MTLVNVGLRGYDRRNYGSHLMALAVQNRFAPSTVAVPMRSMLVREHELPPQSAIWLWSEIGGTPLLHRSSAPVFSATSKWALGPHGAVPIGGVVDISGYIYGDPFGIRSVRRLDDWAKRWSAQGLPLVLLSQSIGPFVRDQDQEEMRRALRHVRLVVARDDHSEDTVREIGTSCEIRRAPDLAIESVRTIADRSSSLDPVQRPIRPYALVLPNRQVLRKLAVTEEDYVRVLERAATRAAADGLEVLVAAHAQGTDEPLCASVAAKIRGARVLEVRSAAAMVEVVRDARIVISSRYHGLVAAFANGVPAVAVGWASKYDDLLAEFEVSWMSAPIDATGVDPDGAAAITGRVLDDLPSIAKELVERADVLQVRLDTMWERVFEIFSAEDER
jgi:polysaccharide pyruvyl transferase WcaK-like protein